jgi:ABC-type nickel/cobalt efflux system permease component RcnA
MNEALFGTIVVSGFSVAFVHAALPTHWLPFVLAGRGQGWSHSRTLVVTALAGGGHVLFTVALGVLVAWLGFVVDRWTGSIFPWIASGVLILFGLYYWFRAGHGHSHFGGNVHVQDDDDHHDHDHGGHEHEHPHPHVPHGPAEKSHSHHDEPPQPLPITGAGLRRGDAAVVLGLVSALTFSPCEGFLPVFVAGVRYGWWGFTILCIVLAVATLAGMLLLTWLTLRGLQHLKLEALDRYEGRILGGILIALGLAVILLET